MEDHPNMIVKQELFDRLIQAQIALFKQIEAKQRIEGTTITQEEADFANVFLEYAKELTDIVEQQL